ncbi:hypothetical protein AB8613_23900 [Vibrio sp. BS-M-Sm-2]|uniref:hypothetical protein n=1 Tax=Vibrio sp. BS-M-Sm-2 TaxID=3241167 RepID=UPI003557B916
MKLITTIFLGLITNSAIASGVGVDVPGTFAGFATITSAKTFDGAMGGVIGPKKRIPTNTLNALMLEA